MINSKELRIGNKLTKDTGVIFTVYEVKQNSVKATYQVEDRDFPPPTPRDRLSKGERMAIIDLDKLSPIPLSPEILEKAGFKKIYHEDFSDSFILNVSTEGVIKWEDDGSILINDRLDDGIGYATNCVCKYVHQLQNLIHSLTGQELTINL